MSIEMRSFGTLAGRDLPRTPALEPQPHPWMRNATITSAGGFAAAATAAMVDQGQWSIPLVATSVAGSVAVGFHGYRNQLRGLEIDRACEQLAALMSMREPSRAVLTASRWTRGWPGRPQRLTVRYPTGALALDDDFAGGIATTVSGQAWGTFRLVKHDRRRCRMVFVPDRTTTSKPTAAEEAEARARRTLLTLLGPTGKILKVEHDAVGAVTSIEATHAVGEKLAASGYRTRIERTVSTLLPGRWRGSWNLETDWVRLEQRPEFPQMIHHRPPVIGDDFDPKADYDQVAFAFGQNEDGQVMSWRPAIEPMMIVTGSTGTGKTSTMHTLLLEIVAYGWPVWVLDGKGVEFLGFQDCPDVQIVASTIEHQIALVHRAHQVMEERYAAIVAGDAHESDFDPLVVFLDEFSSFQGNLLDWYSRFKKKGDPSKPPATALVADIARKGRLCRVHLIMAMQRPDQQYLGGDMRDNFRCRVSYGRLSPAGAMMMWDSPVIGVAVPKVRGRGVTITADDVPQEIQGYYTPDPRKVLGDEDRQVLDALWPTSSTHPRLVIQDPEPMIDLDETKDGDYDPGYRDYAAAPWGLASEYSNLDPVARRARREARQGPRRTMTPTEVLGLGGPSLPDPCQRSGDRDPVAVQSHDSVPDTVTDSASATNRVDTLLAAAGRPKIRLVPDLAPDPVPDNSTDRADDSDWGGYDWEGYSDSIVTSPMDLHAGDLVLVDEGRDEWAVVDTSPELDPFDEDEDTVAITYSGDVEGVLSVPLVGEVTCRRPSDLQSEDPS